jgi:hypothetical protein
MVKLTSQRRVYKTIGDQEIDVDVYMPENAKKCPVGEVVTVCAILF